VVHKGVVRSQRLIPVSFFKTDSGHEPVRDWLLDDVSKEEKIIGRDIMIVQISWPDIGMPLVEAFGNGLWQVRSELPHRIARVFFTFHDSEMILLHGFIKKTGKTPESDLRLARKRQVCFKKG
jgi:phage-related protein